MRRRRRRDALVLLAGAVLALAGCAAERETAEVGPYDSGRYRRSTLVTARPTTAPATSYRLPTTNLAPGYDYDDGEPRRHEYVEIGPYNAGYPVPPDYDTANRTLYEQYEAEYGYPYTDGFYGAPTRPRFYGSYHDWYYGPRYRYRSPWHRFHLDRFDHRHFDRSRFDRHFDRIPHPYRSDRDDHDGRRIDRDHSGDRGDRYERGRRRDDDADVVRRPSRAPAPQRSDERRRETTRRPEPEPEAKRMGRVDRPAQPERANAKFRAASKDDDDDRDRDRPSRIGRGQSRSR